jgi:hypothetical protein
MHRLPGGFPELKWRDYLLVDGWTYRTDKKHLLFVKDYEVLSHVRACSVLERIFREEPRLCEALLQAYDKGRFLYEHDTLAALKDLLGICFKPFAPEVNRFGQLIVFERKALKPTPPPEYQVKLFEPAPLSDKSSWVTIECVDDREPPRPVPDVSLEVITEE